MPEPEEEPKEFSGILETTEPEESPVEFKGVMGTNLPDQTSVPPTTTAEQDRGSLAQRTWNDTWENTQARIAQAVVYTTCIGIVAGATVRAATRIYGIEIDSSFPPEWWAIVGLVIGFYFGRTNHSRPQYDFGK